MSPVDPTIPVAENCPGCGESVTTKGIAWRMREMWSSHATAHPGRWLLFDNDQHGEPVMNPVHKCADGRYTPITAEDTQ